MYFHTDLWQYLPSVRHKKYVWKTKPSKQAATKTKMKTVESMCRQENKKTVGIKGTWYVGNGVNLLGLLNRCM